MNKTRIFWGIFFLLLIATGISFYKINHINYIQHKTIQASIVEHPDKLPSAQSVKFGSFGFINIAADAFWLQTVQYIGDNAIGEEYKKYLGVMMNLITDLSPYFEKPYTIGQLLLPASGGLQDSFSQQQEEKNIREAEQLGLKGVNVFCDIEKIEAIKKEDDLNEVVNNPKYANPCKGYKIPYYLAYIYFFYLDENINASDYYKVVSAQDDAPKGARVLAAIMQGKGGDREKSLYMFLSLASNSAQSEDEACSILSEELQRVYTGIKSQSLPIEGGLIAQIENISKQILPALSEENERSLLADTECTNFLAKATRELNLMYIEQADTKYVQDNPSENSAYSMEKLFNAGYINFIPTDYQQYPDGGYGVTYIYKADSGRFDYQIQNY